MTLKFLKKYSFLLILLLGPFCGFAQQKAVTVTGIPGPNPNGEKKVEPKAYGDIITSKAISKKGLFTVHKVEDKWYFEIPDSILGREILVVTRYSKTPAGGGNYGGEQVNQQTVRWEKGLSRNILLRVESLVNIAPDSTGTMALAVKNSNLDPIIGSFDIKAFGRDSSSVVIEVTDFFKADNQSVSITPSIKRRYNLGGLAPDKSYIRTIKTFPINTEISSVKTFTSNPPPPGPITSPFPSITLPAAEQTGLVTMEINNSFLLLPKVPMRRRIFDPRVGYFSSGFEVYEDKQQRVENSVFIHHYRLEPKPQDLEKWKNGELVEPQKQIVYYIDPATPKKWRPYLIAGINDWNKAFEKAGFKNAIAGKEWPENDPSMSLEDARFCVVRYFASDIENAYGPNVADPRSGEILESHIGWYHNVMKLVHNWYMIQTAAVDSRARKMKFDDELMGDLIRFVSSHEVGHTLGLRHNMGSSSKTPVELLRNKKWVEANGHTASIMDYARFNYVAQPEDQISKEGLYPRIGVYDKWAIEWGYRPILNTQTEEEDKKILNKLIIDSLRSNPRLWFGGEAGNADPRAQTEDLGDNSMKASEYGIKNLKRILPNLPVWTKEEGDKYENLNEMYGELVIQFGRYMGHVSKNIGGIYETFKSVEEPGNVYEPTPKPIQKEAITFLNTQLFSTPNWLLNQDILDKTSEPSVNTQLGNVQVRTLNSLLTTARLFRMNTSTARYGATKTYSIDDLMSDLENELFSEVRTHKSIDPYRRTLEKTYVEDLGNLLKPAMGPSLPIFNGNANNNPDIKNTDIPSLVKAHLSSLRSTLASSVGTVPDKMSQYHIKDILDRIKLILEPKS